MTHLAAIFTPKIGVLGEGFMAMVCWVYFIHGTWQVMDISTSEVFHYTAILTEFNGRIYGEKRLKINHTSYC